MRKKEYQKKRKFFETPEPDWKDAAPSSRVLHFVIHKHNARRLHYDLRLELGGTLKSWAIPKGPSLNPEDKRLAMMVEDHPFDYRNFEGVIPKNNYGAGEVIIWDEGVYSSLETTDPNESEKHVEAGLKKGHVAILLQGEKLQGAYDLVKLKNDKSWLFVKRADEFARKRGNILNKQHSVISGQTIDDLKHSDDPQWILKNTSNAPMPKNISPMLATFISEPFDDKNWLFEPKLDGYRAIAEINTEKIKLFSRKNMSLDYQDVIVDLKKIKQPAILDGEITVLDEKGISHFQWLQNYGENQRGSLIYYVFDLLYYDGKDLTRLPLIERKKVLREILPVLPRVRYCDHFAGRGIDFFEIAIKTGLEGVVAKKMTSKYYPGVRSANWLKLKVRMLHTRAIIAGYTAPRSGSRYFGALILGQLKNGKLEYIGHTGSGFNEDALRNTWSALQAIKQTTSPFNQKIKTNAPVQWVKPMLACEVEFSEWTDDMHLRQPIFIKFLENFNQEDVSLLNIIGNQKTYQPTRKEVKKVVINNQTINFSNPSKVLWHEEKITRKDLLQYYLDIAPVILLYLKDRPQNMLRHPNGWEGESFYQKNAIDLPVWTKTKKIHSDTEERDINYFLCQDAASLAYMINLGCIEINPWNSRINKLEFPDYIIIDLDPGDVAFEYVIKTALVCREVFEKLEITSYCKTSGKTGLHIFIPTAAKYDYDQTKNFSEILARLVHNRTKDFTSIERDPKKRQKKVYLDYLQNRRGQTLAAAYAVRPVRGAMVSTPLKWSEVNKKLKPSDYNTKNIQKRLQKYGDLWKPVLGKGIDIEKIFEKIR